MARIPDSQEIARQQLGGTFTSPISSLGQPGLAGAGNSLRALGAIVEQRQDRKDALEIARLTSEYKLNQVQALQDLPNRDGLDVENAGELFIEERKAVGTSFVARGSNRRVQEALRINVDSGLVSSANAGLPVFAAAQVKRQSADFSEYVGNTVNRLILSGDIDDLNNEIGGAATAIEAAFPQIKNSQALEDLTKEHKGTLFLAL